MKDFDQFTQHSVSFRSRLVKLWGEIDEKSAETTVTNLMYLDAAGSDPVTILLSTFGGSVYDGLCIYDAISSMSCHVTVRVIGKCMSAGTFIMLAGDDREAYPHTTFMVHSLSDVNDGPLPVLKNAIKESERLNDIMLDIYRNNTLKSNKKFWESRLGKDTYMDTQEALEVGLITKIIGGE